MENVEIVDDFDAVMPELVDAWDALAVRLNRPYCAPAWVLAWRHLAPPDIRLRIVVVRDGERVVAVAPFYAQRWRAGLWQWRLVGSDNTSRIEPVADPDHLASAGRAIADAIQHGSPRPARIWLEGIDPGSPWPALLAQPTRGRAAWRCSDAHAYAPNVTLDVGDIDELLGRRSSNFRQQMRRHRRQIDKDGGEFRHAASAGELRQAIGELVRLHHARWTPRGGSRSVREGTDAMLLDAAERLGPERFRLVSLTMEGKVVNSQLFVAAGAETAYWNGGFDTDYSRYTPSQVALVDAIRHSIEAGHRRFDLGPGVEPYKYRLSDGEDRIEWVTIIPRRARYLPARALFAPKQVRRAAASALTREQKQRLRRLLRRPSH